MMRLLAPFALLVASACSGGGGTAMGAVLQVSDVTPPDDASGVELAAQVIVFFSRPIDPATAAGAVEVVAETGESIPGTITTSALNPNQIRFTPLTGYFPFAQHFILVARVVRDTEGNLLDRAYEFAFQTQEEGPTLPGPSQFEDRGPLLALGRWLHRITPLDDGTFLVAGGYQSANSTTDRAEILDPAAGSSSLLPGTMTQARAAHVQVRLSDGRVLLAGGESSDLPFAPLRLCEIFDPVAGTFAAVSAMAFARSFAHGVLLADGRVLVSGGQDGATSRDDAEIYDPVGDTWAAPPNAMEAGRSGHSGGLLPGGDVVLVGGTQQPSAIRFRAGAFQALAPPQFAHFLGAATVLPDGRPFVAGGLGSDGVSIFDDAFGFVGAVNRLAQERVFATATAFADGRVLIVGGFDTTAGLLLETADLFFPIGQTGRVYRLEDVTLPVPTSHHAAARDPAGRIWITGGLPTDAAAAALRQVTVVRPE